MARESLGPCVCRFFGWIRRLIHNKKDPEMNLANVVPTLLLSLCYSCVACIVASAHVLALL